MRKFQFIQRWTSRLFVMAIGLGGLGLFLATPASALEVSLASLQDGQVHVVGKGAAKGAPILWQGAQVAQATNGGTFNFTSADVPAGCVGELTDGTDTLFIAVNGCTASGVTSPDIMALVPATGQTNTFAAGDDGDLQKGVVWPDPRFTDNGDGTITDHLTGLIWLKNANCFSFQTWGNALAVTNSLADGACGLADGSVAGDWRLPNVRELQSLVDYGRSSPSLPLGHPFSNFQASVYWSSTTGAFDTSDAWFVNFSGGFVNSTFKTTAVFVIAVRGGS